MRAALTTAAVAAAVAAVYAVPATTNVAAVRPVDPAAAAPVADRAMFDAEPVYHVVTDLHVLLEAEPEYLVTEHDHASHVHAPARTVPRRLTYGRWRTPEAAMRHLVRAYNTQDAEALKDVTTPAAREMLDPMRAWAPDLRLVKCEATYGGYDCTFTHAVKGKTERGDALLQVRPARKQGWYATLVLECG